MRVRGRDELRKVGRGGRERTRAKPGNHLVREYVEVTERLGPG